ncbi:hypothetical protein MESS4_430102 [Mesorhizobium sp. STM 4661]|nr:hypothetical protein MESS4_430102 [Mesorhizobium sp. STM 4661]
MLSFPGKTLAAYQRVAGLTAGRCDDVFALSIVFSELITRLAFGGFQHVQREGLRQREDTSKQLCRENQSVSSKKFPRIAHRL